MADQHEIVQVVDLLRRNAAAPWPVVAEGIDMGLLSLIDGLLSD